MADPLSISASIAGLMTIADIVIRNGYKYVRAVRDSDKAVAKLISEVNSLSGILHSLRNIAEGLEGESAPFISTTQVHHVESCYRTLRKINDLLDKFELSKKKGLLDQAKERLRWPLTHSETKALASEVEGHREKLALALNADEMSALIILLARQDALGTTLSDIKRGLEKDRVKGRIIALNDARKEILDWLVPANIDPMRNQESAVTLRQPGTGVWFTNGIEFQEWKLKSNSKLWLHGIPGAGKTILMSTVIQELAKIVGEDEGFAFFYCDYKDAATQQLSNILGSLIKQLVLQKESAFDLLITFHESYLQPSGSYRSPNPESMLRILHQITDLFSLTTVLIDGLDEITSNRLDAINVIQRIQQDHRGVRVLYASRREANIEQSLGEYQQVSIVARSSDLELYVASEIDTRTRKRQLNIKDPDLKETIMKRLIHGADGMFRWVACQIDHLCELPTDKARAKALDKLPRGLPETYERILGRVLESHTEIHDLVSRTLQWLACALQPLSGRALLEALAITPGDTCFHPDAMTTENEILRWGSSLVRRRATGDGIELAHFTVKEYLLSIESTKDPRLAPFKICTEDSNLLLGQVCLTYLNLDELGTSPPPENIFDDIWSDDSDLELEEGNEGYGECSDGDDDEDNNCSDEESGSTGTKESIDETSGDDNSSRMQKGKPHGPSLIGRKKQKKAKIPADAAFAPWCDKYPLLRYAANNWDSHLRSYHQDPLVVHLSHKLFDPRKSYQFLWWSFALLSDIVREGWERNFSDTATLHWAALLSRHEVCSWLLKEGSDVNRISELGSPLDCAILGTITLWRLNEDGLMGLMEDNFVETEQVSRSKATTVHYLLRAGARVDKITDPDSAVHPLEMALILECGNPELISYLLDAGALIDEPILELVNGFLASQPDCVSNATVPRGIGAVFSGTRSKNVSSPVRPLYQRILHQLSALEADVILPEQLGAQFDIEEARQDFLQASEHGVCRSVSSLRKLDPEGAESTLTLGLFLALHNNHADVVDVLLSNGLSPNEVDADGNSSVHRMLITHAGNDVRITIQNIKKLVEYGADLAMRNNSGECPIHIEAKSKHDGLLKAIFELVAAETTQSLLAIINPSLLQYAIAWGCDGNVELLVQKYHAINPIDHQSKDGMSLITLAANRETALALRLLHQRGLTTSNIGADGSSVLFSATGSSSGDAFNFLMGVGAVDNSSRPDGKKAIHEAVTTNWPSSSSKLATLLRAGQDPNTQTFDGSTPLTLAAGNLNMEKLQLLAEHKEIDINCRDSRGMTPLMMCSQNLVFRQPDHELSDRPNLVPGIECLIKHKADVALVDSKNEGTALHYLTAEGITSTSFDIIKLLVAPGASLYSKDRFGFTPFEFVFRNCTEPARKARSFIRSEDFTPNNVLRFIINNACDHLNDYLSVGIPPLNFALKNSENAAVELLLAKEEVSVDVRSRDNDQRTALEIAASSGCTEGIARALLFRTDNPMSTLDPLRGYTLLHFAACDLKDQQMLRILLERGVDIETLNKAGETALHTAILKNNLAAVRLLLAAGADAAAVSGSSAKCSIYLAADAGNLPIVEALIRFGADINASSTYTRSTALHIVSRRAPWDVISFLIRHGANIDGRDITGATPYIEAAKANRWDIVRKFVKTTADLSVADFDGLGAIHYAILAGSVPVVKFFQRHGISLSQDIRDHNGNSHGNTLACACIVGSIDLFRTVWENGVTDCTNDYGWGLAHFSVRAQAGDVRSLLLSQNVDWTLNTALVTFQSKPNADWAPNIAALTFHSKHPSSRDIQGLLPLHIAAAIGNDVALNFLSRNKLIPDMDAITTGVERYSSLHLATTFNRLSSVSLLARLGSDINLKAKIDEETALHIAARLGFVEIVSALLEMGCQPNPVDAKGITPKFLAIENNHQEIATILGRHLDSLGPQQEAKEDADLSASVLGTGRGKSWRISIAQSAHIQKLMTRDVSIYAMHDSESSEELKRLLEENKDHGVYSLGKPLEN